MPARGRAPVGGAAAVLAELVTERGDATLAEYADRLAGRAGIRRSLASACRARRDPAQPRLGVPGAEAAGPSAEERTLRAAEQDRGDVAAARAAWRADLAGVDPRRLVFVDESGVDTRLTRPCSRAPRGHRAPGAGHRAPGAGRWASYRGVAGSG
jgi:hypothetical protein